MNQQNGDGSQRLIGIVVGVLLAFVLISVIIILMRPAKASLFQSQCELYVPKGAWTFDTAANLFEVALRHEAGDAGLESLSREDYTHAGKLVSDCVPAK